LALPSSIFLIVADASQRLRAGSSTVGTSNRTLEVVTVLGFGIPVAFYIWFLHHYTLNVVHGDQWSDVNLIGASYQGHLTLAALWGQHNENRLLFPNLIVLAMSRLDAFNVSQEEYLSAVFLLAAVALIIAAHKRRAPERPWIVYCPVVILMVSVVQAQNTLWGFQLAWYMVLFTLAGVIFLLDRPALSTVGFVGAMILAVVGSYSSFQGLLIWVAGLLLLFYRRRPGHLMVLWIAGGVITTVVYFYNFDSHAAVAPSLTPIHLPGQAVRFFFESIGDVLGVPLTSNGVGADLVIAVGCVIFALALFTLWSAGRRRHAQGAAPIGMALTVFGLLFALSTTYGRAWGGPGAASASRYTTYDLLILVGVYLTFIGTQLGAGHAQGTSRAVSRLLGPVLGCVIALVAAFGIINGIRWAKSSEPGLLAQAAVTVDIDRIPGPRVQSLLGPAIPAHQLREDALVLSTHGLSLYSDPQAVATYRHAAAIDTAEGLFKYTPPPATAVVIPSNGKVLSGRTLLLATAAQDLHPVRVDFVLNGGTVQQRLLVTKKTLLGWFIRWNTSTVPNGTYQLGSVVDGRSGVVKVGHPILVIVRN
jgi:hypothetical protein